MGTYAARLGEGLVGGIVGTAFIHQIMGMQDKMPESLRGPEMKGHPGDFVLSQGEKLVGRVPDQHRDKVMQGLSWAYGSTWGSMLGLANSFIGFRSFGGAAAAGAALGTLVWAVGYVGWMPAAGLVEPVHRQGATHVASSLGSHVIYGLLSGLVMHALDRVLEPKRGVLDVIFPRRLTAWGMLRELLG